MKKLKNPKSKRLSWDETLMNLSIMASKRTACKFHETGAVFVDKNKRIISIGYNGPTSGDYHCIDVGCAKVDGEPETGKLRRCRGAHAEINGIINCCSGEPISIRKLVEDYLKKREKSIKLNFGYYGYPDYVPMAFWGDNSKLKSILGKK